MCRFLTCCDNAHYCSVKKKTNLDLFRHLTSPEPWVGSKGNAYLESRVRHLKYLLAEIKEMGCRFFFRLLQENDFFSIFNITAHS